MKEPRVPYLVALERWKREYFLAALDEANGHQGIAAEILGVHLNTLNRLLRASGLTRQAIRRHRLDKGLPVVGKRSKEHACQL